MKIIKWISGGLSAVERSLVVVLLGAMMMLAFLQVILRNVFSTGFLWADPLLRHLVLWVGFIGASLATQQEKHINIDLFTRFLSQKISNVIHIATNVFAGIVCSFLAHAGWTFFISEQSSKGVLLTIGTMEFPTWWFQLIIPVGFGLMAFRFFIRTIEHGIEAMHPTQAPAHPTNVPIINI